MTWRRPTRFYIWPVLSGAFQFVGNRMSQPYGSNKNADSQQAMMNKIMQFMPLYLIVIYLNFAAGAVIYWTFSASSVRCRRTSSTASARCPM